MTALIPLTRGYMAIVDDEDAAAVLAAGKWHAMPNAHTVYARKSVRQNDGRITALPLHTFLTGWSYVDHRDGDGLNNTRANLRQSTHAENMQNRQPNLTSASGYKGVHRSGSRNGDRWRAAIRVDGRLTHLGYFADPADAARAYDVAASAAFGEFARLNFPEVTA